MIESKALYNSEGSYGVIPEALIFPRFSTFSCAGWQEFPRGYKPIVFLRCRVTVYISNVSIQDKVFFFGS